MKDGNCGYETTKDEWLSILKHAIQKVKFDDSIGAEVLLKQLYERIQKYEDIP